MKRMKGLVALEGFSLTCGIVGAVIKALLLNG